ncbi:CD276 antigen homolog [Leuresthes tenuis]|uniref:CD276 antigen homolog n=1 Tax=Leuresthes tenuis TaxID=355514 RepID=UPI003B501A3C
MEALMRVSVWMLLTTCWTSVSCQQQEVVEGFVGGNVMLPCSYSEALPEKVNVFWRDKDDNGVLNIENNSPETTSTKHKGRVISFQEEYKKGNFSFTLTNLRVDDGGVYECNIGTEDISFKVTLKVSEGSPADPPSGGAAGTKLHVFLLSALCLLLCF